MPASARHTFSTPAPWFASSARLEPELRASAGRALEPPHGDTILCIEEAVRWVLRSQDGEAGLRQLDVFLIDAVCSVDRDPALELAADDLHTAARVIVGGRRSGQEPDQRRRRLLSDAERRFIARFKLSLEALAPH
jgi:hypothetical protein